MKGLELSEKYYNQFGKPMLENDFPEVFDRIAVGLVGEGSECFGFDDGVSTDHDFEAGFCLWITEEDEREFGFKLERAYAKLPNEYNGYKRSILAPVGANRHGVMVIDEFYSRFLGDKSINCVSQWLNIPSHYLATACNGKVFKDDLGEFSKVRQLLLKGYPEDVRRKKLSANAIMMAQAGQYNYGRCISHGERGAAQLAVFEFVKSAISTVYLLNNKYQPFYKWAYKGMRNLEILSDLEFSLTGITELANDGVQAKDKAEIIEDISKLIISEYKKQGLTKATCNNLETHAYSIQDGIKNANVRNMHIMEGI